MPRSCARLRARPASCCKPRNSGQKSDKTREMPRISVSSAGQALLQRAFPREDRGNDRHGGHAMQDSKPRSTRRAVIAGALALTGAPFIRRASAQPAAGVSPQLAELYEKAKPEAEVTIWAPGAPSVQWIPAEFAKRFPAVKVNWLGDQQASSRLIAEKRAGRHAVDVWTFSLGGTLEVQKRGLLEKFDWRKFGAQDRDIFWDGEAVCEPQLRLCADLRQEQAHQGAGAAPVGRPARCAMDRQAGLRDFPSAAPRRLPRDRLGSRAHREMDQDADRPAQAPDHHLAGVRTS